MSLTHITFSPKNKELAARPMLAVENPWDCVKPKEGVDNKLQVQKVSSFFGEPEIMIIGKVVSGVITDKMQGSINGKEFRITQMDSKYRNVGKEGMTIGITVRGLMREEIEKDAIISFG